MADKRLRKRLEATAHHEAAHAVAAWWLQLPFKHVTIKPDAGAGNLGHLMHNRLPKWFNPEIEEGDRQRLRAERHIITSFAGQIAEAKYRGRRPRYGMEGDDRSAINLAMYFFSGKTLDAFLNYCFLASSDLVNVRWREIQSAARALLDRETLSHDEVRQAICDAVPLGRTAAKGE